MTKILSYTFKSGLTTTTTTTVEDLEQDLWHFAKHLGVLENEIVIY